MLQLFLGGRYRGGGGMGPVSALCVPQGSNIHVSMVTHTITIAPLSHYRFLTVRACVRACVHACVRACSSFVAFLLGVLQVVSYYKQLWGVIEYCHPLSQVVPYYKQL